MLQGHSQKGEGHLGAPSTCQQSGNQVTRERPAEPNCWLIACPYCACCHHVLDFDVSCLMVIMPFDIYASCLMDILPLDLYASCIMDIMPFELYASCLMDIRPLDLYALL